MEIEEIFQKIEKSLITLIKGRLHRCEMYWKARKICEIISWNLCNQESV